MFCGIIATMKGRLWFLFSHRLECCFLPSHLLNAVTPRISGILTMNGRYPFCDVISSMMQIEGNTGFRRCEQPSQQTLCDCMTCMCAVLRQLAARILLCRGVSMERVWFGKKNRRSCCTLLWLSHLAHMTCTDIWCDLT